LRLAAMPKRKPGSKNKLHFGARTLWIAAAVAVAAFVIGEIVFLTRSESGQLAVARHLGMGDHARLTQIVGHQVRNGLSAVGVARDSIAESVVEGGRAAVRWRVGLKPSASSLQANYAITKTLEASGGVVLDGRESWAPNGVQTVTLLVGLPGRATHEVRLVRAREEPSEAGAEPARLALILFGWGDEPARADSFFALPAPFAVAIVAGTKASGPTFKAAHERNREVVVQIPLEPINYPQVSPGPGTILVTMKPTRVASTVRRYIDQAAPVAAVANHMGSLATQDMTVMGAMFRELRGGHEPFLHVNPVAGAVCKSLASDVGVVYDEPDAVIEGEAREGGRALERRWQEVLDEARERGRLVVMIRATPATRAWLPRALDPKRLTGVSVVPLASLLRKPATL
jgi:polysaccharide deacetylase 2 family uncharacterized protein YibQ